MQAIGTILRCCYLLMSLCDYFQWKCLGGKSVPGQNSVSIAPMPKIRINLISIVNLTIRCKRIGQNKAVLKSRLYQMSSPIPIPTPLFRHYFSNLEVLIHSSGPIKYYQKLRWGPGAPEWSPKTIESFTIVKNWEGLWRGRAGSEYIKLQFSGTYGIIYYNSSRVVGSPAPHKFRNNLGKFPFY